MHYNLLIITNGVVPIHHLKHFNYLLLDEKTNLETNYLTCNGITFDYLIFSNITNLKNVDLLKENDFVITNMYFQTNYEHIFAIGPINHSHLPIETQWEIIIHFLVYRE